MKSDWKKAVVFPLLSFISGALVSKAIDLAAVGELLLAIVAFLIVLVVVLGALHQRALLTSILEKIDYRGTDLSVDFVNEFVDKGKSYQIAAGLIKSSTQSLVFLDYWVAPREVQGSAKPSEKRRSEYYMALSAKLKSLRKNGNGPIFKRIVQMPNREAQIGKEPLFCNHLRECINEHNSEASTCFVKKAPLYYNLHFCIIDSRYVVWPILATHPTSKGLRRAGALIIDDRGGRFVKHLNDIFNDIDKHSVKLNLEDLGSA